MNPPKTRRWQHLPYNDDGHNLAVVSERLAQINDRLIEHVEHDEAFQERMMKANSETQRALKAIELHLAGWRGTAVAAVTAVSAVWAVAVLLLNWLN